MCLPSNFHDEADGHAGVLVGAAERVNYIQLLVAQFADSQILDGLPDLLRHGMVVVLVRVGGPPHGVLGVVVNDDILVFGGAAGVDAGHNVDGAQFADLADLIAFQTGLRLFGEEHLVGRIVDDLGGAGDAILAQIQFCHRILTSF